MEQVSVVGIDLAKNVFMAVGMSKYGKVVYRKKLYRDGLADWMENHERVLIGMEACNSSHYWARIFEAQGHTVKLMAPHFVKPYVKSNKNDSADAEAICEAVSRPTMRFVAAKSQLQQELQMLHRARERVVKARTALVNELRGFLSELGIVLPKSIAIFRSRTLEVLEKHDDCLGAISRELFRRLFEEFSRCDEEVKFYDKKLLMLSKNHPECRRLQTIPGIGPLTATALLAIIGDFKSFKNGRQFSASLGLVPRQHSTGGKSNLLGISKRGNSYLRKLLVHGARSVVRVSRRYAEKSPRDTWVTELLARRGMPRTIVALANKNARIAWAVLSREQDFDPLKCSLLKAA